MDRCVDGQFGGIQITALGNDAHLRKAFGSRSFKTETHKTPLCRLMPNAKTLVTALSSML